MTNTLIFTKGGGRLGNQLVNYANLYAFQCENPEFNVFDLAFVPFIEDYSRPDLDLLNKSSALDDIWHPLIRLFWDDGILISTIPDRIIHPFRLRLVHGMAVHRREAQSIVAGNPHISCKIPGVHCDGLDLTDPEDIAQIQSKSVSVVAGWNVRAWPLVEQYRDEIRHQLRPGPERTNSVMDYIESLRDKYDLLVGLHIRQSDYREWHDGEFYYTAREYWDMAEAFAERSSAESMAFLIASDETHDNSIFDHDKYHMGLGDQDRVNHYVEDFVKLSHCDIVLAPPSTFSAFAAFLGDLPLVPLYEGVTNDGFQKLERPLLDSIDHPVMSSAIR